MSEEPPIPPINTLLEGQDSNTETNELEPLVGMPEQDGSYVPEGSDICDHNHPQGSRDDANMNSHANPGGTVGDYQQQQGSGGTDGDDDGPDNEATSSQVTASKLPPKVSSSRDNSKMLLHDFKDDSVRSLTKAGQQHFHQYIAVIEAFPFANEKETICRSALDQAAAMTCDEDKPWKNEVFGDLIKAQWWGPKGDARRLRLSRENVYMEVPIQMLALVTCAVDCTLTGLPVRHNLDFMDTQYRNKWASYVKLLQEFQQKSPKYMAKVVQNIQDLTGHQMPKSTQRPHYDFQALEDSVLE
ncbi:hypothetical protein SCLCIDRAFT_30308 [Scleroderma citrinum Foug A]|uniref:DUF6532 domain-containing protein n=1 Tax=Scleroderma citrinum Foug A TaxID=1036808 RepID=A0A0C3DGP5_9AGAM|nr:hypothetical protein SCLCIDRAFT_30308 [Scleroderma citrinum Foug A]